VSGHAPDYDTAGHQLSFQLVRLLLPELSAIFQNQGSGHIINLSSVAGTKVFAPGGTVYSATKFAVRAISEGLRQEVGSKVRVTSIEPGAIDSDLKFTTTGTAQSSVMEFYEAAIPASSVARAISSSPSSCGPMSTSTRSSCADSAGILTEGRSDAILVIPHELSPPH
jgi:NAD(P)-dependent dehydrogenase (short-subunit alcohol dehydrogenase family)